MTIPMFTCRTTATLLAAPLASGGKPRGFQASEPRIDPADAADLCAEPYSSRTEALAVARRLRAAGWVVVEHRQHRPQRSDNISIVASIYHPVSYESPGDVRMVGPDP